eukprot:15847-Eustigmatos_ZCMA.PRE.1
MTVLLLAISRRDWTGRVSTLICKVTRSTWTVICRAEKPNSKRAWELSMPPLPMTRLSFCLRHGWRRQA